MNSVVRQLWEQNTDIVMVDTGNSYEGLCEYVGGKYIAYTEDKPITMNPFNISKRELNIEKIDFLKNLILLIWKGSETQIPELEFRVVEQLVTEYYDFYFNGVQPYPSSQKETLRKNLSTMEKRRGTELTQIHDKVEKLIKGLEERRMALRTTSPPSTATTSPICSKTSTVAASTTRFSTRTWIAPCSTRPSSSSRWMPSRRTSSSSPS